jgi:hypothetical protein
MKLAAHIGAENRAQIEKASKRWKLGNADTLRRLVVLGLGDSLVVADTINKQMADRQAAIETHYGRKRQPSANEKASKASQGPKSPTVAVRLPKEVAKRVQATGGLRAVIERGLDETE